MASAPLNMSHAPKNLGRKSKPKNTIISYRNGRALVECKEDEISNYSNCVLCSNNSMIIFILLALALLVAIFLIATLIPSNYVKNERFDREGGSRQPITAPKSSPATLPPTTLPPGPWDKLRLPRSVVPSHYELHLNVDPNKDGYDGEETITVDVTEETPYILIHSSGLNITEASVLKSDSNPALAIKNQFDSKNNSFHVIETAEPLNKGQYKLKYKFHRLYRKGLYGLFKGVYRRNDGKLSNFLSTQLEPIDARTMFPCFDEPALKATFKISLAYPKDMVGLSNGAVEKEEEKDQTKYTYYKTTPKMSVYLVSVVVGHFTTGKPLTTPSGVKLRAFAQPGTEGQVGFALNMGNQSLTQMEELFGIKYPMSKLDFVATPEAAFAMENWGSMRFSEDYLLYKKDFSSEEIVSDLMLRLVAHEVIHMWFGNYVTMKWWNDIWINEAVTEYYTYFDGFSKTLQPDWKRDDQFVDACHAYALEIDGYINTRPVIQTTTIPTFGETFDRIVYKKGSSLLNMAKHFYPKKENFNKGMKEFLTKYAYSNVIGVDLWDALQTTCPLKECPDFKEVMDTWMKKKNYPVLTLKKTGNGKYTVTQERFVYDQTSKLDKTLWRLQFTYFCRNKIKTQTTPKTSYDKWMTNEASVDISCSGDGWIKLNLGQIGFYRVNYDKETWRQLAGQLSYWPKVFSAVDRYGMIDDAFNLVRGGRLDIKTALNMTTYLRDANEMDYMPWLAVQRNTGYILGILPPHSQTSQYLKKYLAYQSSKVIKKLGYRDTGTPLEKLLRMVVVGFQCDAGSRSCLGNLTTMFHQWKTNPLTAGPTPALRKMIYFYGARLGTPKDWDLMLQQLEKNTIATEYRPLMNGLAGSHDMWTLYRYLKLAGNETYVKRQYSGTVLDNVANHNPDGPDVTWTYLLINWKQLKQKDPLAAMMKYLPKVSKRFSNTDQLSELEKFINDNLEGREKTRSLLKTLEVVKLNIAWRKAHESDLGDWLKEFLKSKNILEDKVE